MNAETEQKIETITVEPVSKESAKRGFALTLGMWGFYFVAKLGLYGIGLMGFHVWENLAFALFILSPIKHPIGRSVKQATTFVLAFVLLYYDSWLPPLSRVWARMPQLSAFDFSYLMELAGRFISLPIIAALLAVSAIYWLALRWVRLDVPLILIMLIVGGAELFKADDIPVVQHKQFLDDEISWTTQAAPSNSLEPISPPNPSKLAATASLSTPLVSHPKSLEASPTKNLVAPKDSAASSVVADKNLDLQKFFTLEATRAISFSAPKADDLPFDIIFMHVCSLSWDDLRATDLEHHPLWQRFDFLLTRFNSASTYSGPAAIRIQRATCGQPAHSMLYNTAPGECYLMDSLKRVGFEPTLVLNHDGQYDNFLKTLQTLGRLNVAPLPLKNATITQRSFDGRPVYDDLFVLNRWLENRQQSSALRAATYYNTVSLHDGNRLLNTGAEMNSSATYKMRLTKFLDDTEKFMQLLEKSGRRVVIAMVPEHGAAFRGDKMQIAGLREIPSPAITLVPVGIKIMGANLQRTGNTLSISKPTSYTAVAHLIASLLKNPPYKKGRFSPADYVAGLPATTFVSQNEDVTMVNIDGRYYLRQNNSEWVEYTDF